MQWGNILFSIVYEKIRRGIYSFCALILNNFCSLVFYKPFGSSSHWLLIVWGHYDPVALRILGNGPQHHIQAAVVAANKSDVRFHQIKLVEKPSHNLNLKIPFTQIDSTMLMYFLKRSFHVLLWVNPPVIGVLPALMDWVDASLFLRQLPLFVHVSSSHQLHAQTETFPFGQTQSLQQQRSGLLNVSTNRQDFIWVRTQLFI